MAKPTKTPQFDPNNFNLNEPIDNKYLTYTPGTVFKYNVYDADGNLTEKRTVTVTGETKTIAGVECLVVIDEVREATGNNLVEVAYDYFAQDKDGNVWYFGEDVENYEDGQFVGTEGSWLAGIDGAQPGVVMETDPHVGDKYDQENAKGVAEDYAVVISVDATANLNKLGTLNDLLKTNDVNPLDTVKGKPAEQEFKYYSTEFNTEVYATTAELVGKEYVAAETIELVSVTTQGTTQLVQAMASFGATESVTAPLTPSGLDEHASQHALAAPGHLT